MDINLRPKQLTGLAEAQDELVASTTVAAA
jgi:hypothetical protein